MTTCRSEVTLKFNELPAAREVDGKVELKLTDQCEFVFTVTLAAKAWRKAVADAESFEQWGGALTGKLGEDADGLPILVDAGIKIFEKKAKEPATVLAAETSPEPPAPTARPAAKVPPVKLSYDKR